MSNAKIYEIITEKMVARIEEAIKNKTEFKWVKPWTGYPLGNYLNYLKDGDKMKEYRGINRILLDGGLYITMKQLNELEKKDGKNYKVKKGSHAETVYFYKQNIVDRKDEKHIRRMFGYLFAKAMEEAYRKETMKFQSEGTQDVEYQPSEAWEETIHSQYDGVRQERLEFAREYGEQFYTDFLNFYKESDENYEKELEEALVVVQELGAVCAFDYLSVDKEGN